MKSLEETEQEIITTFGALETIDEKYALLFKWGEGLPPMDPALKTEENLVKGCQSNLWFHLDQEAGRFHLAADSDSMVVKGISALLVKLIEGRTADELLKFNMGFIDPLKIWKLASERNNGLMAMLAHIHQAAENADPGSTSQEDKNTPA